MRVLKHYLHGMLFLNWMSCTFVLQNPYCPKRSAIWYVEVLYINKTRLSVLVFFAGTFDDITKLNSF